MISQKAAREIELNLGNGELIYMQSELTIATSDGQVEIGMFYSSSIDLNLETLDLFKKLTYHENDRTTSLITPHIATFACPTCPDFIKKTECVSDGQFCAYFPGT